MSCSDSIILLRRQEGKVSGHLQRMLIHQESILGTVCHIPQDQLIQGLSTNEGVDRGYVWLYGSEITLWCWRERENGGRREDKRIKNAWSWTCPMGCRQDSGGPGITEEQFFQGPESGRLSITPQLSSTPFPF